MKPPTFEYFAPRSIAEALETLSKAPDDSKLLAGGQSLVPMMNFRLARPERLIDLNRIEELAYIERRNGVYAIGAMTRHAAIERSSLLATELPLLGKAMKWVGHEQIRNRGTIGGSVAHADPAAELGAVLAALDARVRLRSATGERVLSWSDFFVFGFMTALEPDEILVELEVPSLPAGAVTGFVEFARRHGDFALGGAAAMLALDQEGVCQEARLALLAAAPVPVRAAQSERLLVGSKVDDAAIAAAAEAAVAEIKPTGDIHGSTKYRIKLLRTMAGRAIAAALQEGEGE